MRRIGLDFLRGIAVILVLFRHSLLGGNIFQKFGWLGVDLFFVLSGFLISNLLFTEYKKNGSIQIKRFLLKRGFKIFPPFYFFAFASFAFMYLNGTIGFKWSQILPELFYLQSYFYGIFLHTWSLSVEEHFYLLFSIILFVVIKKEWLKKKISIILTLIILLNLSFYMRLHVSTPHIDEPSFGFVKTHLRMDGIIIGVLVSYLLNFTQFITHFTKYKLLYLLGSALLILPGFIHKGGSFFMNTFGLSSVNMGFGIIVIIALHANLFINESILKKTKKVLIPVSFIGINSYSIYLWHLNAEKFVDSLAFQNIIISTIVYFSLAISWGIAMSYLIEKPFLKLRTKFIKT